MGSYPGGKAGSGVYQTIINLMPPHRIYVEGFLGGGAIMRQKRPAPIANIGIDCDAGAIQFFQKNYASSIQNARLMTTDALTFLRSAPEQWIQPDTLVYLDPPYLKETRSCQRKIYRYEMTDPEEHLELLEIIRGLPCLVMISGYYSDLYVTKLQDWRSFSFQAQTRGGWPATEYVWMNFPEPMELHDYRFLGSDYRERERIKRRQTRWKARLERMDSHERYALLSVLQDLRCTNAKNSDSTR